MINTANSIAGHGPSQEEAIEYLADFMTAERLGNMKNVLAQRTRYMTICTENTFHTQNASALVRHCEAFGIQDIWTIENLCRFRPNVNIVKGSDKWITFHRHGSAAEAILGLKNSGYRIIATSPHADGKTPSEFDIDAGKFCVVFGTEHEGISDAIMDNADGYLTIPMCGFTESLNVSASAAIIMQMLAEKIRKSSNPWQLGTREQEELLFEWMRRSIRDSERILKRKYGNYF